jgi:putative FmdB family regulatory protein
MPTYEYVCLDCAERFEVSQRIGDAPPSVCQVCGGKLRRVFHPIGIVLKGSGFYRTESRPKQKEPSSDKKEPSSDKKEPSSGKKEPSKTGTEASSTSSEKREKTA